MNIRSAQRVTRPIGQPAQWEISTNGITEYSQILSDARPESGAPKLKITSTLGANGETLHLETDLSVMELEIAPDPGFAWLAALR